MERFARLYAELDASTRTSVKLAALERYFAAAPPEDAVWALQFLTGRRVRRAIGVRALSQWAGEVAGLPAWLLEESYDAVGDLGETLALVLPPPSQPHAPALHEAVEQWLLPLPSLDDASRRAIFEASWRALDEHQRFVWHKLVTGAFRVGVAATLVSRALAKVAGVSADVMAHRLMGDWQPTSWDFQRLLSAEGPDDDPARPFPFYLAYPLEQDPAELGDVADWQIEWKWDGIRAQLIRRARLTLVWSRGEELIAHRFPEITAAAAAIPDGTVLDGEILCWRGDTVLPFALLQRRIGRKTVDARIQSEAPVIFLAFDVLEENGEDLRPLPIDERRARLERIVTAAGEPSLRVSPTIDVESWEQLARLRSQARELFVEGVMLKRRTSGYGVGRKRGDWWKWKIEPYTVDAVLIYAQRGSGRRASLYTDYTFGVWDGDTLVPVAKAYSGLTDAEIRRVDRFVKQNTTEKFGPVRSVEPRLVFELAFEGIQESGRHRAGVALRFPRMARWREDKLPEQADTLDTLKALVRASDVHMSLDEQVAPAKAAAPKARPRKTRAQDESQVALDFGDSSG